MHLKFTKLATVFFLLFTTTIISQHTFSIVAVDPVTGEIGSAGATCIAAEDGAQAISDIVLGVGAIHTQSFYTVANQNNARTRMMAGDSPQQIIDWLIANDINNDPSQRQYNIVDLNGGTPRSAAFTGPNCFAEFIHITGSNYAIAGNILISQDVVNDMETAFNNTAGTLVSDGISSASAFLRVASSTDTDSSYGNLSLDLNVWITSTAFEPIDALQTEYNNFLSIEENEFDNSINIFPNPANETAIIKSSNLMINGYEIININGKIITEKYTVNPRNIIYFDVTDYNAGLYFVRVYNNDTLVAIKKLITK